ncbi:MAG: DNA-binding transcriptional regulator [Planctomycetota bacterium]
MPKKVKTRSNVALLVETSRSYGRDLLRGIADFARTRSNWSLLHQEMTIDVFLPDWMRESKIDGIIARVDAHSISAIQEIDAPCVDVRCSQRFTGIPQVETDDQAVAKMAFDHLWERGFRRFAYCGYKHAHFSEARLSAFREAVAANSCSLSVYETDGPRDVPITNVEQAGVADAAALSKWLMSLQPPTGVFVCNDIRGQQVLNTCSGLGIAVPDDLGVIGVDDDDAICPLSNPPLTSVRPNAKRIGYRAAEILHGMIERSPPTTTVEYVQPIGVVQRLSTRVIAVDDREVARVCRFIREHACDGIDVHDVAEFAKLSRRQLERRFRSELDRSPHDEITAIQIERVKELLRESDMTLEQIAPLAGYTHKERLGAVFKRVCSETPGEFRRRARLNSSGD